MQRVLGTSRTDPEVRRPALQGLQIASVVAEPGPEAIAAGPFPLAGEGGLRHPGGQPILNRHAFHTRLPPLMPGLYRRALTLTANHHRAEDLVQATLLKAWAHRESYQPDTRLGAWLFTILRNTFVSDLRKQRHEVEDIDGAHAATLSEEPRQLHTLALKELLAAAARLPDAQRRPLLLMAIEGLSQLEVANACGCTVGTIKSRVSRGRSTLQDALGDDGNGTPTPRLRIMSMVPPSDVAEGGNPPHG